MNNDDLNAMLPSDDDRRRAVEFALKNSKWAAGAVDPRYTDEQKAQQRLEAATVAIFKIASEVKTADIANGGEYNSDAMGRLILSQWKTFTESEDADAVRFMLSLVLTGQMLEAVSEL